MDSYFKPLKAAPFKTTRKNPQAAIAKAVIVRRAKGLKKGEYVNFKTEKVAMKRKARKGK